MRGIAAVERAVVTSDHAAHAAAATSTAACTEAEDGGGLDPDDRSASQPQMNHPGSFSTAQTASGHYSAADEAEGVLDGGPGGLQLVCSSPPPQHLLIDRAKSGSLGHSASSATDGEYCINLPVADKAALSSAIICDTLGTLPVTPQAVTNLQGPVLEVHQVDDNSVDVKVVHSFRATYGEPIAEVRKRAVAYLQQKHAAEAAGHSKDAPAALQQQVHSPFSAAATDGAQMDGNLHHQHHHHHHRYDQQHQGLPGYQDDGMGCYCTELQEGEEQMLPHFIKRTACCVVHEQETGTDTDDGHPATASSMGADSSLGGSAPPSLSSLSPAAAAAVPGPDAGPAVTAAAQSPFAASPFQAANLQPFSLPRVTEQLDDRRQLRQHHQQQQQQPKVRMNADKAAAVHGGNRLSVEVLKAAGDTVGGGITNSRADTSVAASMASPAAMHVKDISSGSSHDTESLVSSTFRRHAERQRQRNVSSSSGPSSSSSMGGMTDSAPTSAATVAVAPGPAAGDDWQQQQPVLVTMSHRKTAHGHEEVDIAPLHTAERAGLGQHEQQHEQQQHGEAHILSTYAADMAHQHATEQQQQEGALNQMDMNVLRPPQGFMPLSGQNPRAPPQQQQPWSPSQGLAMTTTPSNPPPTLMMPRGLTMGQQRPRAAPRQGFMPRCEWELDPRKVLVGRRLAVGGFAEVFLGKYEGTVVAVKRLLTNDAPTIERFVSEVRMLARLRHPNLILFMGYCVMPELCIISEYMSKGSLYSVLHSPEQRKQRLLAAQKQEQKQEQHLALQDAAEGSASQQDGSAAGSSAATAGSSTGGNAASSSSSRRLQGVMSLEFEQQQLTPEQERVAQMEGLEPKLQKLVAISVARGMAYLHTRNPPILHLDLKSPNILVDDRWRVKITDFGLSRARQQTFVSSSAQGGTPEWMAPEVLRCESVAEPADVYSFGVVLWELITGRAPWENYNPMQVVAIVGFRELTLPLPATAADPFLLELCKRCLQRDAAARPTFPQIAALLDQHYGPPAWSSHAQPLMPLTPRPALPAPAAAVPAAAVPALALPPPPHQLQQQVCQALEFGGPHGQQHRHADEHVLQQHAASVEPDGRPVQKQDEGTSSDDHGSQQQHVQLQEQHIAAVANAQDQHSQLAEQVVEEQHSSETDEASCRMQLLSASHEAANDEQQQQQQQQLQSQPSPAGAHAVLQVAAAAAVPAPSFVGGGASPFAGNLAPWSFESVQSIADEAAAAARRQQQPPEYSGSSSSTVGSSSRLDADCAHCNPANPGQQPHSVLLVGKGTIAAAAAAADVAPWKGDSSSVQSELPAAADLVQCEAAAAAAAAAAEVGHLEQQQQDDAMRSSSRGGSPAVADCVLRPGPECLFTPVKVGACMGPHAAVPQQQQQQQQQQQPHDCITRKQLVGVTAGELGFPCTQGPNAGEVSAAAPVLPATVTGSIGHSTACTAAGALLKPPLHPAAAAAGVAAAGEGSRGIMQGATDSVTDSPRSSTVSRTGSVDRHVLLAQLRPQLQAYLLAAVAAAGGALGGPAAAGASGAAAAAGAADGPASAPAASIAHESAAWHALLQAAGSMGSLGQLTSTGLPASEGDGSSLLHGFWPSMTEASLNSIIGTRQHSRSDHGCEGTGGCAPRGSSSSSSREDSRQLSRTMQAQEEGCGDGGGCYSSSGGGGVGCDTMSANDGMPAAGLSVAAESCCPAAEVSCKQQQQQQLVATIDSLLPTQHDKAQQQQQQQQQQLLCPMEECPALAAAPAAADIVSDCSRSSSPDTARQQQQQEMEQAAGMQAVYQVWPVMAAPSDLPMPLDVASLLHHASSSPGAAAAAAGKKGKNGVQVTADAASSFWLDTAVVGKPGYFGANGDAALALNSSGRRNKGGVVVVDDSHHLGFSSPQKARQGFVVVATTTAGAAAAAQAGSDSDVGAAGSDAVVDRAANGPSSTPAVGGHAVVSSLGTAEQSQQQQQVVEKPSQNQQQQQHEVVLKAAAPRHVIKYGSQQHSHSHTVDASVLKQAALQAGGSSSYQKGRFMVSTTAVAAAAVAGRDGSGGFASSATPPRAKAPGSSSKTGHRSSCGSLTAVDLNAAARIPAQHQHQQSGLVEVAAGSKSLPDILLLRQQPAVGVSAAAASAAAMCSVAASLELMSAFAIPTAHGIACMSESSANSACSSVDFSTAAAAAAGQQQQQRGAVCASALPSPTKPSDAANGHRGLGSKGYWGSGTVRECTSGSATNSPCSREGPVSGLQTCGSGSSTCSRDSSCSQQQQQQQRRLRGCSSPGSVGNSSSGSRPAAVASKVDGPLSQPSASQLLQMHFSTGGLCYRTGRFSVTVQQPEVYKAPEAAATPAAAVAAAASGVRACSSTDALAAAAAAAAEVTLVPVSAGAAQAAGAQAVVRTVSALADHQGHHHQQQQQQQCGVVHPSASCGALPILAAQQQIAQQLQQQQQGLVRHAAQQLTSEGNHNHVDPVSLVFSTRVGSGAALLSTERLSQWDIDAAVRAAPSAVAELPASRRVFVEPAAAAAAAAGAVSHPLDGELSSSSPLSIESCHALVQQHQQQRLLQQHPHLQQQQQLPNPGDVAASPQPWQQQQQQGPGSPLHQRRLLAQPPPLLVVPVCPSSDSSSTAPCAPPLPLQQQQQQPATVSDCQPPASACTSLCRAGGRLSEPSAGTPSSILSITRTISGTSSSSTVPLSPRSTVSGAAAASSSCLHPAAKPPLVPFGSSSSSKTPSPGATPLHSPRPKTAAMARDYCRGRFQVHESPLVGPWQAWKHSSCGALGAGLCGPCPTPVALPVDAAAGGGAAGGIAGECDVARAPASAAAQEAAAPVETSQQQQQQHPGSPLEQHTAAQQHNSSSSCCYSLPSAPAPAAAASMKTEAVSPRGVSNGLQGLLPYSSASAATVAAAAAAAVPSAPMSADAATVKKLGRFTVKHESGSSSSIGRSSKAGSAVNSAQGSRAASPRGEHAPHHSKLGSHRHSSSGAVGAGVSLLSAAAPAAVKLFRNSSDLTQKQQQQQPGTAAACCSLAPAAAAATAAIIEQASHAATDSGSRTPSRVSDADAAAHVLQGTAAEIGPGAAAAPQLAPIKTVSKKGRFVVTQVTPGSTACSTPKSSILFPPAAAAGSTESSFTGSAAAVAVVGGPSGSHATISAAAAAAAAWLEAAAVGGASIPGVGAAAAAAGGASVVVTCPVCDAAHAVCASTAAPPAAAAGPAGSAAGALRSPLPPASPRAAATAAAAAHNGSKAAAAGGSTARGAAAGAADAVVPASSSNTDAVACNPVGKVGNCINYRTSSPSNTPRAESPLYTCCSCGAPLPPVAAVVGSGMLKPVEVLAAAAAAAAGGGGGGTNAGGSTASLTAEGLAAAVGWPAAAAAAGSVHYVVQPGDVLDGTTGGTPHGLLAEAATRVLAARQQQQQQMSGLISPECSSSTVASGAALSSSVFAGSSSSFRTSHSNIAGPAVTAAAAASVLVGQPAAAAAAVEVLPLAAWQGPQSHPLQLSAFTAGGSSTDDQHGDSCYSPVSSLTMGSRDPAAAAAVTSPARQQLLQAPTLSPPALSHLLSTNQANDDASVLQLHHAVSAAAPAAATPAAAAATADPSLLRCVAPVDLASAASTPPAAAADPSLLPHVALEGSTPAAAGGERLEGSDAAERLGS